MKKDENSSSIKCCMVGIFNYFVDSRVRMYTKWMINAGNKVDVLTLYRYDSKQIVMKDGARVYVIPSSQNKGNHLVYLAGYALSFLVFAFELTKLYLKNWYDVIHFHNMPDFLVFAGLVPKLFGAKLILDVHDPMPEMYKSKFPSKEKSLGMKLVRLEERLSAAFAHEVIAANVHFKDNLISRGIPAQKITVINNFPDLEFFQSSKRNDGKGKAHDRFTLIFPGTIAPRYGLEIPIKSLPLLVGEIPNLNLLIIGRLYEHADVLKELANQLGMAAYVEFRPGIPNDQIPDLLVQADVGIYPALPDSHMSIAVPGKLLEFAIMGLPIVTSRLQIVEEIFDEQSVLYFEPGNVEQFAQCILRLYRDKSLQEKLVENADQDLAEKYSQEMENARYMQLISRLLGSVAAK